ncbi:MAG: hypothetical protein O7G30_09330 [Proteobacteria bacterium]|nr:hypothetical protein [Pseudomonadota bacterium]
MARRTGFALRIAVAALTAAAGLGFTVPSGDSLLESIRGEDREALASLSLYPADIRSAIVVVAAHPQALVDINRVHRRSSDAFAELLRDLPRSEQEKLWDLVRYPALVSELVEGGVKSETEARAIAAHHPESIRETAVQVTRDHGDRLVQIHALRLEAELAFDALLEGYPEDVQAAFRTLTETPEVLTILTEHMHMAVLLGGAYARDPEGVEQTLAELGLEAAQRNAEAGQDWEDSLAADPAARAELEQASEEYAAALGEELGAPSETRVIVGVHSGWPAYDPYPYWYGYPGWRVSLAFADPYFLWYPAPYWVHSGFYFGPSHQVVHWRGPSRHFVDWHAHRDRDRHRAPHFERHHDRSGRTRHVGRDGHDRDRHGHDRMGERRRRDSSSWRPDERRRTPERREPQRVAQERQATRMAMAEPVRRVRERSDWDALLVRLRARGDTRSTRAAASRTRDSSVSETRISRGRSARREAVATRSRSEPRSQRKQMARVGRTSEHHARADRHGGQRVGQKARSSGGAKLQRHSDRHGSRKSGGRRGSRRGR